MGAGQASYDAPGMIGQWTTDQKSEVDDLVGHLDAAGGRVVSGPEQKAWGYTGTFTDPDGHLWEAIVSAI